MKYTQFSVEVRKMASSSFLHVGITVTDIERTIAFYEKYFGFHVAFSGQFPDGFFDAKPRSVP
jgi:catechol 2,3-dioxygenase-like lactoylglutathione lyase family enzyme